MTNKVLLKKSSVAAKVPLITDLDYGELALNYADGKLYFKNSSNVIKSFTIDDSVVTLTGTQTLTNKTLTSPTISNVILTGTLSAGGSTGTSGQVLQSTGTGIQWSSAGAGSVTSITAGSYLTGGTITTTGTLAVDATSANTASKVVARDASGNFSAGTITAALTGNATTATTLATARNINGVSFNGSADILVPSIYDSNYRRITNPGGGEYVSSTATVTGAIAVTLPVGITNTMVRMTIKIYEYSTNKSFEVHVGGYNYTGGTWANNPFAYIVGNPSIDRRFNVRLGYTSGSKFVVYIGELASTWSYPQVYVTEVQCGFGGQASTWTSGWSIGVEATAFQNVTATISNCQVSYSTSTNTANAEVLRDASGNFSAGTITATLSGNASTATTATNLSNTGTVTLASATESNSISITAPTYSTDTPVKLLNFDWYSNVFSIGNIRSGSTASNGLGVYYTASGGSRTEIARFGTDSSFNVIGALKQNGNQVLHAGNYNSYTPTLTGTGASGTWGISVTGNAATVTNGVYITGSYADPAWITSLAKSKVGLGSVENTALSTWTGTTNITTIGAATASSLTVTGDLTVNGTTTTINSTTISVDDKNIELGSVTTPTNTTADGGGITLKGATDKTFNWVNATAAWTSSEHIALAAGKNVILNGSTSGSVTLAVPAAAGTTTITLPATTGTVVTTGDSGTVTSTMIADGTIVNADINASAAIAVSKLAASTISGITLGNNLNTLTLNVSGTGLSGSTTYNGSAAATFTVTSNATNANTASTIVARDASGNFSAGTITATLSGNASTVTNGVYTTGSYSDPSWLTISKSKVGLGNVENTALSTWAGSSNITTLGTIATGTWNATTIGTAKGGTGLTSFTANGAVYATSTSALTTGTLPVASGGTGVTTSTGSGSVVLSTSPTLVTPVIGAATGTSLTLTGALQAATKSFLIPHPTKEGKKLRYGSLEGPENGVYVRGKLKGSSVIELPEYWTKLVDPDSITVNLTCIGKYQKLYVMEIKDNKVYVGNENLMSKEINCFYTVYGERIDVDKLEVEID